MVGFRPNSELVKMAPLIQEEYDLRKGWREVRRFCRGKCGVVFDELPTYRAIYYLRCSADDFSSEITRYDFELNVPVQDARGRVLEGSLHNMGVFVAVLGIGDAYELDCKKPERKIRLRHE